MAEEPFLFADFAPAASEPAVFDLSVNRPWHDGKKKRPCSGCARMGGFVRRTDAGGGRCAGTEQCGK